MDRLGTTGGERSLQGLSLFLSSKKTTPVTDEWYGSGRVSFSDDGKYLMLSSSRDFKPTFGDQEFANVYVDMQRIYFVTLSKDTESPVGPRSDEVGKEKKDKDKDKSGSDKEGDKKEGKKDEKEKKPVTVKVDLDGIQNRIVGLEITPGNYNNFRLVDNRVFYLRRTVADNTGDEDEDGGGEQKWHLCSYSLEDRKETVLGDVKNYQISFDGKKDAGEDR
jgi:tricorn protease